MYGIIINVGHKTRSGDTLSPAAIEKAIGFAYKVTSHRVVTGEYEGVPEETSVLHCVVPDEPAIGAAPRVLRDLSEELDQECIAVAHLPKQHGSSVAIGRLYGDNPKGYTFDWAQFRI